MNKEPLVSVVMPFYNNHEHIVESAKSVLDQTYQNFEIIMVNDSPDSPDPKELLSEFAHRRIKFINHEHNKGLSAARNTGHQASSGELVLPLDCDDMIVPTFLTETVEVLLNNPQIDAVYTQVHIFGELNLDWTPDATMINIMCGLPIPSTVLYRRKIFDTVGGYNTSLKYSNDCDFWLRALSKGIRLHRIEKPLYHYRKHSDSMSEIGRLTEVADLAKANRQLYIDNLIDILTTEEQKYLHLKTEYAKLQDGFELMKTGYADLLRRYDDAVAQLQKRSIRYNLNKLMSLVGLQTK